MLEMVWRTGTSLHCWWECKSVQSLWKTEWRFLKKTKNRSAIWSWAYIQRKSTDGQKALKKMLNITDYQRNTNQNYNEVLPHTSQNFVVVQSLSRVRLFATPWTAARLPCPSPSPRARSNSCPLSQWCHPAISSSVVPFSCLQYFPASASFPMSRVFASDGKALEL